MAQDTDMLYSHLERLPPRRADQHVVRTTRSSKAAAIAAAVQQFVSQGEAPDELALRSAPGIVSRHFLNLPHGQLLLRIAGDRNSSAVPLLLLHDAPGSSLALEPWLLELSAQRLVLAVDLPGCGDSAPLPPTAATLQDFIVCVQQALSAAGVERCALYGNGFGSSLAVQLAAVEPERVEQLLLHGVCLADAALREQLLRDYAPDIALQDDGSHWYRCWLMLRDSLVYFPWYDRRVTALRRVASDFNPQVLHQRTFETVKQLQGYPQFIRAALRQDTAAKCRALPRSGLAVTLLQDAMHPFAAFAGEEQALAAELGWTLQRRADSAASSLLRALA